MENRYKQKSTIHDVLVRCLNCKNVENVTMNIYDNVQFIEEEFCHKCNDDIEYVPRAFWYDAEYNSLGYI